MASNSTQKTVRVQKYKNTQSPDSPVAAEQPAATFFTLRVSDSSQEGVAKREGRPTQIHHSGKLKVAPTRVGEGNHAQVRANGPDDVHHLRSWLRRGIW